MKNFILIIFFVFGSSVQLHSQYLLDSIRIDCNMLNSFLDSLGSVCFIKVSPTTMETNVWLVDCDIEIGMDEELRIPSKVNLRLIEGNQIKLSDNGKISGDHFATSRIIIGPDTDEPQNTRNDHVAINMEGCDGCEVSNLTITKANGEDNGTGITIDSTSTNNEINTVKFLEIDNGIIVSGDGNTLTDLEFFKVAVGDTLECDPYDNEFVGIKLETSNNNRITNVTHVRSQAAVTLWLNGECNNNEIINVSVEQENSKCPKLGEQDPCIYIDNLTCVGNLITTNLNHGRVVVTDEADGSVNSICQNNTITTLLDKSDPNNHTDCTGAVVDCHNN